jgi:20S proteasome alpha/beta subunit
LVDDAIHTAISTLNEGFDSQLTADLIGIGVVDGNRKFRVLSTTEIKDVLNEAKTNIFIGLFCGLSVAKSNRVSIS